MPSAHAQILLLEKLANRPGLQRKELAILEWFAQKLWQAHRSVPNDWWLWTFAETRTGVYVSEEGWNVRDVLRAFARIDPHMDTRPSFHPMAYAHDVPKITSKAIQEVCGLTMTYGRWEHDMSGQGHGFWFLLPE